MGNIFPQQSEALSHGISPSTCSEVKQKGQWFLQVFLANGISFLHLIQVKVSLILVVFAMKRSENWTN